MHLKSLSFFSLTVVKLLISALISPAFADGPIEFQPEGWKLIFRKAGIVVETQSIADRTFKAYRAKGILKAPIEQILETLGDNAAASEWMPDLAHQQVITEVSAVEMITLNTYAVPFPFADRELLLHNQLRLDLQRRALMAKAVSIEHPGIPVTKGSVRARLICSQTWFRPVAEDRTEVEFILMVEPRGRIPSFLAALGLRHTPFKFLKALESRARTTEYPVRLAFRELLRQLASTGREIRKNDPRGELTFGGNRR